MTIRIRGWRALILLAAWPLSVLATSSHIALPGRELWLTIPSRLEREIRFAADEHATGCLVDRPPGASFNILITPFPAPP